MKIRPYLTFNGNCNEAIELYKKAFKTEAIEVMYFSELPPSPGMTIPEQYMNNVLQVTIKFGDDFIRMSDCGPMEINDPQSERISIAVETKVEEVKYAFRVLSEEGTIGMPLAETFYSPCAGVVFDKFGVMWNFVAQLEN